MRALHAIGFDDAPFARTWRGDVGIYGAVYAGHTLHAVVSGRVRRDGRNSTAELTRLSAVAGDHVGLILVQGIALAGFNVVDIHALEAATGRPVLVVARRPPDLDAVRRALLDHVPGGASKWRLVQAAGEMEPCAGVWVQRAGLTLAAAGEALASLTVTGRIPEPLRAAHVIAGGVTRGSSRGQRV
ncbi:hypothetical protein HNQ07_003064 [Deinococcus metalli]|uniref:UPF0215 protein n=1 Tax=Deinococcus metalli TaxID=1141878 RepID=A0A7W8NSW6_9DEIO|nr:DUF99 family protein [Deinococcus metalli]MBB5377572.1 hypothetical protein [Deinococcus metalli]GHF51449.1 UPF0215 protein [Deinococcus metalli]